MNTKFPLKKLLAFYGSGSALKSSDIAHLPSREYMQEIKSRLIFGETWEGIDSSNDTFVFENSEVGGP